MNTSKKILFGVAGLFVGSFVATEGEAGPYMRGQYGGISFPPGSPQTQQRAQAKQAEVDRDRANANKRGMDALNAMDNQRYPPNKGYR